MDYYRELQKDVRFVEGLNACINCGVCTAICPAAAFYDYDPRHIANTLQRRNNPEIEQLLKSDTIWYCGECLSCRTRCPRDNTPGYIIQSLRALSIETGLFTESSEGRKQLDLKRTVGEHILQYGYCVFIDEIQTDQFPEQGPIWDWIIQHRDDLMERFHTSYGNNKAGTLRNIPEESLEDLRRIFDETGATRRFRKIESFSKSYAMENKRTFEERPDDSFKSNNDNS